MASDARLYLQSSLREEYVEYIFLAGICKVAWQYDTPLEVLRTQTDAQGYDLILDCNGVQRHIQLKSSRNGGSTADQKISTRLAAKPSGCVVWIVFDEETLEQTSFLFFGGHPNSPLPELGNRIAKHTKGNSAGVKAERPNIRVVTKGRFDPVAGYEALYLRLFGEPEDRR
ncbi:hypothetical protein KUV28_14670 [Ferrimonas balearica]|nr:hypothetical protein [Ferrimonas balearica]